MASDPRDYKLDLSSQPSTENATASRPYLMVTFACCGAYTRIYRNTAGTHYSGNCPRCAKRVKFVIGEGGTSHRAFIVE